MDSRFHVLSYVDINHDRQLKKQWITVQSIAVGAKLHWASTQELKSCIAIVISTTHALVNYVDISIAIGAENQQKFDDHAKYNLI